MTDRMVVNVEGRDNASDEFQKVGRNAQRMGQDVERAGRQAERGFRGVGDAAKRFGDSLEDVGTAVGVVVGGLSLLGQNALGHQRSVDALGRAYGDSADEVLAFTEAIQDSTNFSNDAAREAALVASGLVRAYGLTADEAQRVVEISADLAQVYGISLADATTRVTAAIRGEGEAAEALGLNMSDAAVAAQAAAAGLTGWNTTMTEGEKAAFRYNLVLEQTAQFQGAAGDAAQGAAGAGADFRDWLDDTAEAAGRAIGPTGEFLAVAGNLALAAPLAGNAIGRLATGFGTLATTLGPAGLALAGTAAAAAIGYLVYQHVQEEQVVVDVDEATKSLIDTLNRLAVAQGEVSDQFLAGSRWRAVAEDIFAAASTYAESEEKLKQAVLSGAVFPGDATSIVQSGQYAEAVSRAEQITADFRIEQEDAARITALLAQALQYEGEQFAAVSRHIDEANRDFLAGRITLDAYLARLEAIPEVALAASTATDAQAQSAAELEAAIDRLDDAVRRWSGGVDEANEILAEAAERERAVAEGTAALDQQLNENAQTREQVLAAQEAQRRETEQEVLANVAATDAAYALAESYRVEAVSLEDAAAAMGSSAAATLFLMDGMISAGEQAIILATVIGEVGAESDALGGQIGQTNNALRDMEEAYDILNQRRAEGQQLSAEELDFLAQYDQRVATATGNVEDWEVAQGLLAARQLDAIEAQENLNDTMGETNDALVGLVEPLQTIAEALAEVAGIDLDNLAPPEDAISGWRLLGEAIDGARSTVPGDATGGFGTAVGPAPAAAPTEPALFPVVWTVTADVSSAEAAVVAMDELLDEKVGEDRVVKIVGDGEDAYAVVTDLEGDVLAVVDEDYVVVINGNGEGALSEAEAVALAMAAIDGTTATVDVYGNNAPALSAIQRVTGYQGDAWVNVYAVPQGGMPYGPTMPYADGGVVSAANGRLIRAGEVGPEWIDYPGGGGMLAAANGAYVVPQGSYVHTAPTTRAMAQQGGRSIGPITVNVYAQDGRDAGRQIQAALLSIGR